jgi:hypothetical protein
MTLQVINARKSPLTDVTAEVLVCRLHVGPSGKRESGVVIRSTEEKGRRIGIAVACREEMYFLDTRPANRYLPSFLGQVRYGQTDIKSLWDQRQLSDLPTTYLY